MKSRGVFVVRNEMSLKTDTVNIEEALDLAGHGRYTYCLLLACSITYFGSIIDLLGFSIVVPAASCDLQLSLKESAMLTSISYAGFMFALPWGYFADTRGRRKAILISSIVGCIFSVINSFSTNFLMMLIVKFIGCSFSTACLTLTTTYLGECVPQKHRRRVIFLQNCFCLSADFVCFGLAYIFLPLSFSLPLWSTFTLKPWRLLSLTFAIPLALGPLMVLFFHESPKFLANKGETEKALEVLKCTYEINGGHKDFFPVKVLIDDNINEESVSFWESIVKQTVLIFKPPLLWKTIQLFYLLTICCSMNNVFFMWFPTMVNSFYNNAEDANKMSFCQKVITNISIQNHGNENCNDNTPINTIYTGMLFSLFFVIVNVVVIKLSSFRKLLLIVTFIISSCGTALLNLFEDQLITMILFSLIQFTGICIGTVGSYFVEMYHTSYRGLASSLGMMVARFTCISGINLVGLFVIDHCELTFYIWAIFALSGVVAALLLPSDKKTNP